jgi:tRNA(fMet)-specific endonuclease VapC
LTPANGRFLLDTNIIIALLEGDGAVLDHLELAAEVFIPAISLGELFFGAAKSSRALENTEKVAQFAAGRAIVPCDLDVAREYGRLKHRPKRAGQAAARERHLDCRHGDSSRHGPGDSRSPLS